MVEAVLRRELVTLSAHVIADLRTDHAGETGAVWIYRGILAVSRDKGVRAFAEDHLATEEKHLALISDLLPPAERSRLLPIWRVAGWLTGALPALFGPRAVFHTIDAVETFVDRHYQDQIDHLEQAGSAPALLALLKACQEDEVHHRDDARARAAARPPRLLRAWMALVGAGSEAAVAAARRI